MKKKHVLKFILPVLCSMILISCSKEQQKQNFGGFDSRVKWGEHLVTICACNDCHTPKKMTPNGPEPDMSLMLSGHHKEMPVPDIDRKMVEEQGMVVTNDLTTWIGPWGVSYTANLTPDGTGTGNWQESNFLTAIREGKLHGIQSARSLMPPMPWQEYRKMSDDELKAIFAYLKSIKPISNNVPEYQPPVSAGKK